MALNISLGGNFSRSPTTSTYFPTNSDSQVNSNSPTNSDFQANSNSPSNSDFQANSDSHTNLNSPANSRPPLFPNEVFQKRQKENDTVSLSNAILDFRLYFFKLILIAILKYLNAPFRRRQFLIMYYVHGCSSYLWFQ